MAPSGQQPEPGPRLGRLLGLAEQPAPHGHHRVGPQHIGIRRAGGGRGGLGLGQPQGQAAGRLLGTGGLVDVGRLHPVRLQPDLAQQVQPPGAGAGQHEDRGGPALGGVGHERSAVREIIVPPASVGRRSG